MADEATLQEILSFRVLVYQKATALGPPPDKWIISAGTKGLEYGLEIGGGFVLHSIGLGEVGDAYEALEVGYDLWDIAHDVTQR